MILIEVGGTLTKRFEVRDAAGALANAGTLTATIYWTDGTTSAATVTNVSAGVYDITFAPCAIAGEPRLQILGTGANSSWSPQSFPFTVIDPTRVLIGVDRAKEHLNIPSSDDDDEIRRFCAFATSLAESFVGMGLAPRTVTQVDHGGGAVVLDQRPVISVTSVTQDGVALTSDDYAVSPAGVLYRRSGYSRSDFTDGLLNLTTVYRAGYSDLPEAAELSILEILRHLWTTQRGLSSLPRAAADDLTSVPGSSYSIPNRALPGLLPLRLA